MEMGKLSEELVVTSYLVTAEGPSDVAWVNAETTFRMLVTATRVAVASPATGLDDFRILGNPQANGGGTDIVLATHATPTTADAAGNRLALEVGPADLDAQQDASGGPVKGLSASLGHVTNGDTTIVTYVRKTREQYADLTGDSV